MKLLLSRLAVLMSIFAATVAPVSATDSNPPHYIVTTIALGNGSLVDQTIINGPPQPPPGYELQRAPVTPSKLESATGSKLLTVPAYDWSFGCSATSGAMIAAYYDRSGLPNLYTGPTGGGVMPLVSSSWGAWTDGSGRRYGQCPLTASRLGLDGRTTRGSIDEYWVAYESSADDPYITNAWSQHTWGEAIGDYMKTSQSAYGNTDGATTFYSWLSSPGPLMCADMVSYDITEDGTYGRKLFYEARGYTVTECYNQKTDNNNGGFTFSRYKAEIDGGRPVMLNLAGHTVVGVGYDDAGGTLYIHDTWDYLTHTMTWGGTYSGMALQSVSIVNLTCPTPATVSHLAIARSSATEVSLTWTAVSGSDHYEVWSATNQPYFTPGADCANPTPYACTSVTGTTLLEAALGSSIAIRSYIVRAANACGTVSTGMVAGVAEFEYDLLPGFQQ